jgi:hypothetical protein
MDEMTQQNAALVEQAAAAAESLQEQAERLSQAVSIFKLDKDALHRVFAPPPAPARASTELKRPALKAPPRNSPRPASQSKKIAIPSSEEWEEF